MQRHLRRARLGTAILCLYLAGCGHGESGGPAGDIVPDSIRILAGTGGLLVQDRWNRVVVWARARDARRPFHGEVEVQGLSGAGGDSGETWRAPFDAGADGQGVELPFRLGGWAGLQVTFRGNGQPPVSWSAPLRRIQPWGSSILVIGSHGAPPPTLLQVVRDEGLRRVDEDAAAIETFGTLDGQHLPLSPLAYDGAALVVLWGTALAEADPDRLEALLEWVRRGGTIAAVPGPEWSSMVPPKVLDLFGLAAPLRPLPRPGRPLRWVESEPYLERSFGNGKAYYLPYGEVPATPRAEALQPEEPEAARSAWKRIRKAALGPFRQVQSMLQAQAIPSLVRRTGFRYPPRIGIFAFVAAYLGIGFFIARGRSNGRRRLERMYLLALGLALASSLAIWGLGHLARIRSFAIDEITVASIRSGSTIADALTIAGISSPDHRILEASYGDHGLAGLRVSQPSGESTLTGASIPLDHRVANGAIVVPQVALAPNSTRFLRLEYSLDLAGKIDAWIQRDAKGSREIWVRNHSGKAILVFLCRGDRYLLWQGLGIGAFETWPVDSLSKIQGRDESIAEAMVWRIKSLDLRDPVSFDGEGFLPGSVFGPVRSSLLCLLVDVDRLPER